MPTVVDLRAHPGSRRGAAARTLMLGVALTALTAGAVCAQSFGVATHRPDAPAPQAATPAPQQAAAEPTGSLDDGAPTLEQAVPAPPPLAPVEAAAPSDPVAAAVLTLVSESATRTSLRVPARDRAALSAFYGERSGAPLWIADGRFSPKAEATIKRIAAAADDALDPRELAPPAAPAGTDPAEVARADVQLSAAVVAYARLASGGRVAPKVVSPTISAEPPAIDGAAALATLRDAPDAAAAIEGFNPPHAQFRALRKLLKEARGEAAPPPDERPRHPLIPSGRLIQPGDDDPRVPALRARLGLSGDDDDFYFDDALAAAVVDFQKDNRIGSSGLVNRQTLRALNAGAERRPAAAAGHSEDIALIEANMERWRWAPRDFGAKHVFVDIAAFELHIMQDGRSAYDTRVIVGKPTNQTPVFSNRIDHIVVNPYWNVPVSIAMKELSQGSLRGYEVVDSRGRVVNSAAVDWGSIRAQKMRIRQPPGERNALGHIKFMFPNQHSVYLHDTPTRKLFEKEARALSHGCVRVDKPLEFADALSGDQGWDGATLKKLIGGKERGIPLTSPIPVHLTYFTAWVGEDGRLGKRNDLYALDPRTTAALKGEPLPPLIAAPPAPKPKIARAKPKPRAPQTAEAPVPVQPEVRQGPASWLSRLFGDSR